MKSKFTARDYVIFFVLLILFGFIELGFFFADDQSSSAFRAALWIVRLVIAAFAITVLYTFVKSRFDQSFRPKPLIFSLLFIILLAWMCLPFFDLIYSRTLRSRIGGFHPYLQLMPPSVKPSPPTPDTKRVFCLGGSTTEFTNSAGKSWTDLAQALLESRHIKDIKIYNFGRQWYTTQHTFINYQANLRQYKPEIIIVMHAINDLLNNADFSYFSTGPFREDYGHFLGPTRRIILEPNLLAAAPQLFRRFWFAPKREIIDTDQFPGLIPFKRNLRLIMEMAQNDGTQVIFMTQPFLLKDDMSQDELKAMTMVNTEAIGRDKKWSAKTAKSGMVKYTSEMRDLAVKEGLRLIDCEAKVPKNLTYLYDDVHYTDEGFKLVAEIVAEELERLR